MTSSLKQPQKIKITEQVRRLHPNIWAVSLTSFFMDISSEMVINILPIYLLNVLGVRISLIGVIEGVAESIASLIKLFSGWLSDRIHTRKWLAVTGYAISAISKPFYLIAGSWFGVAFIRWADRFGKGIRTAPRDALVADSVDVKNRGLAFGLQRAADTAGAFIGILIALLIVWFTQSLSTSLQLNTFRIIILASLLPAVVAVLILAFSARDIAQSREFGVPRFAFLALGKPFIAFLFITGIFELGNSSDAFLVLRAQERGLSVVGVLAMLLAFNLVYAIVATPAGRLSDRVGHVQIVFYGWILYAIVYLGFGFARTAWQVVICYTMYGIYYGLAYGTAKALVADLVSDNVRGTAYGSYNAVLGILAMPASIIAGILWQGFGDWAGLGPAAPFIFGAAMSLLAAILLRFWLPKIQNRHNIDQMV